jgi:SWI/SNF-related matrix-associated actin-dependent regulator 1 of chromatin subfamily A
MNQLRTFQQEDVDSIARAGFRALLASAPGVGKTIIALSAMSKGYPSLTPTLVVAPSSVTTNWARESRKWSPWAKPFIVEGETGRIPRDRHLYVCSWALLDARHDDLVSLGIKCVIADEAHFAKSPDSNRSMALASLMHQADGRLLLTGTPIVNREDELQVLYDLLGVAKPLMIRRLLEDVAPEIPPKTRGYVHVQLPPKVLAEYRKIERDFAEWLEDRLAKLADDGMDEPSHEFAEQALAAEALVKMGYLRRTLAAGKVLAASDWAARAVRLGEPVVLFAEHQEVIQKLCRQLRKHRLRYVLVDGNTPRKERQEAIDAFQRGDVPIFVGSKAAKEGITLTRAANLLFCERWYTAAEEEQAEDRIRRIGQTRPTKIWFLHAPDTIDDRLAEIVEGKRHIVREAIGAADIEESGVQAVRQLLRAWGAKAGIPQASQAAPLVGYGAPELPALPSPRVTCAVDFRSTLSHAASWAKMNGYHPIRAVQTARGVRLWCHEQTRFIPGSFRRVVLSSDISIVTGVRS